MHTKLLQAVSIQHKKEKLSFQQPAVDGRETNRAEGKASTSLLSGWGEGEEGSELDITSAKCVSLKPV